MQIEFITDIDSPSGYSNFSRAFIRAVAEQGVDCKITRSKHDRTTIPLDAWWGENIIKLMNKESEPNIRMHIETPEFFRTSNKCKNIGFTFWETDLIPSEPPPGEPQWPSPLYNWARQMNTMDEMWTSASFAVDAFKKAGVDVPCHIVGIPIEVPPEEKLQDEIPVRGINVDMSNRPIPRENRPVVIACMAQWTWRKNLEDAITAICTEFRSNEVILLLKTYGAGQNNPGEEEKVRNRVKNIKAMIGLKNLPRIVILQNTLSDQDMQKLYNSIDIFLSTSRGEGFCIPTCQAMARGIPTITTGWSAFTDYVIDDVTGWLVDYHMEPVIGMPHIPWYRPNQQWAKIDMNDLMRKLRRVYDDISKRDKDSFCSRVGIQGREYVREHFSREAIGRQAVRLFESTLS